MIVILPGKWMHILIQNKYYEEDGELFSVSFVVRVDDIYEV